MFVLLSLYRVSVLLCVVVQVSPCRLCLVLYSLVRQRLAPLSPSPLPSLLSRPSHRHSRRRPSTPSHCHPSPPMYPLEEREEDPPRDPDRRDDPPRSLPPRSLPPRSLLPRSPPPARRRPVGFLFRPAAARRVFPSSFRRMFSTRRLCVVRGCKGLCVHGVVWEVARVAGGGGRWRRGRFTGRSGGSGGRTRTATRTGANTVH